MKNISTGKESTIQKYHIELGEEPFISLRNVDHYRSYSIVRKRSIFGWLGRVYYVEKKRNQSYGKYMLYGGKVKYSGYKHSGATIPPDERDDGSTSDAVARELCEELGEIGGRKFRSADFKIMSSMSRNAEGGEIFAADIYELDEHVAEKIHIQHIESHQSREERRLKNLLKELERTPPGPDKESKQTEVDALDERLAGRPLRIRRIWGLWCMIRWTFPLPLPFRIRPDWNEFVPLAAYALMTDARIRERRS